ncbi:ATP-binding protein [Geobacillus kaustophilus]|uniref:ATP-binding protein n=1 Tax=Geobacillus kaustophilus TaxID=1462 RepID=UPI0018CFB059|nr:ATP-binding protein [Geobacillus kaustophilus]
MRRMAVHFRRSVASRFVWLMAGFTVLFFLGSALLVMYQQSLTRSFEAVQQALEQKEIRTHQLDRAFTQAFFDVRGYFAFGRPSFKESVFQQQETAKQVLREMEPLAVHSEDERFLRDAHDFFIRYFEQLVPKAIEAFERGDRREVALIAENGGTAAVQSFQKRLAAYHDTLIDQMKQEYIDFKRKQQYGQAAFIAFIALMLFLLQRLMRLAARQIGRPLQQFAAAAEQFAKQGATVEWPTFEEREDEIGKLSKAFMMMMESIREKEEHLLAQNEELLAQQEELETQQAELEQALAMAERREQELARRNDLIKGMAQSLDKQEVLHSVICHLCAIMKAERGIIVVADEERAHASFGLSAMSVHRFLQQLYNGLEHRLLETKQAFTIRRELPGFERGYHDEPLYSYDLFVPVLSPSDDVEAVIVLSRFGAAFTDDEAVEAEQLGKHISISLQKLALYEEAEKDRCLTEDIFNRLHEGIQLVDLHGTNKLMNGQMKRWFGAAADGWQEAPYAEWKQQLCALATDEQALGVFLDQAVFGPADELSVMTYKLKENRIVMEVYAAPLYRGGAKFGTIFVHRDVTKQMEVDRMKSELVSTVSHELRTPLAGILGLAELLRNKPLAPERQHKYLTAIYQEAERLTALINDFLDVQRMEAGRQTYHWEPVDLVPVVEKVVETEKLGTDIHAFSVSIETKRTVIRGDRERLRQLFTNLVHNAVKYSPDGGTVAIRLYEHSGRLCVDVRDEGLGIPAEALPHIFEKFYRVDNSDRRRIGGTGLGLTIVKEIVKAHGGEVDVVSEEKKGSTFTVRFPMASITQEIN